MDSRIEEHARILVEWSTEVKRNDMVVIRASPESHDLAVAVAKKASEKGAKVMTVFQSEELDRAIFDGADDETLQKMSEHYKAAAEKADVFIDLSAPMNTKALANVPD